MNQQTDENIFDKNIKAIVKEVKNEERRFMGDTETQLISMVEKTVVIEVDDIKQLEYVSQPRFWAIEKLKTIGENIPGSHFIYFSISVTPSQEYLVSYAIDKLSKKEERKRILNEIHETWMKEEVTTENSKCWLDVTLIPTGYMYDEKTKEFIKQSGLSPLVGSIAYPLNEKGVEKFIQPNTNNVFELGTSKLLGNKKVKLDAHKMINYHIGVFGATGCGKSNLISTLITKFYHMDGEDINKEKLRVVIFDVTGEYIFNLFPLILEGKAYVLLPKDCFNIKEKKEATQDKKETVEEITGIYEQTFYALPTPETIDEKTRNKIIKEIINISKKQYKDNKEEKRFFFFDWKIPSSPAEVIEKIEELYENKDLPQYALQQYESLINDESLQNYKNGLWFDKDMVSKLKEVIDVAVNKIKSQNSGKKNISPLKYVKPLEKIRQEIEVAEFIHKSGEYNLEKLLNEIYSSDTMVYIIHTGAKDIKELRECASEVIKFAFSYVGNLGCAKVNEIKTDTQKVLFVFDEAQEFIPVGVKEEDNTKASSEAIQRLVRQGRKYGLHALLASQRLAHLNSTVMSQLQTFFIGPITREYDKGVVAQASGISPGLITTLATTLDVGEWLVTSLRATNKSNIPLVIKVDNNEEYITNFVNKNLGTAVSENQTNV